MLGFLLLLLVYFGIFAVLSLSQNIITGQAGMLSLGHAAFFAIGAYTMAIGLTAGLDFWACFFLAGALSLAAGVLIGLPTLRLSGDYLAIATLGFGEITRNVILNWDSLTRGPLGISNIPVPKLFGIALSLDNRLFFILVIWVYVALVWLVMRHLNRSRFGLALDAVREDEIAARAMGINATKYKVVSFAVGAFFAGQAGTFWTIFNGAVNPASFDFMLSVMVLAMVVLGGMGNPVGAIFGAVIIQLIAELPRLLGVSSIISPQARQIIFGLVLVLMMIYRPQGLLVRRRVFHGPKDVGLQVAAQAPNGGHGPQGGAK
jgi:branched-chain amino acid transport system permease protein